MPFEGVKWIFPNAPTIPITLNGGARMTGWFDMNALTMNELVDDRVGLDDTTFHVTLFRSTISMTTVCMDVT
jgi:hypothetical protein